MGIFDWLFGKTKPAVGSGARLSAPPTVRPPSAASSDNTPKPEMIRVHDQFGRELLITREQWRTKILPENIRKNWSNPDALADLLISALNDGFSADVLSAAEQLQRLTPKSPQATCLLGITLLNLKRLDQADQVFQEYLDRQGVDGSVLTNLAKVQSAKGQADQAEATLWHALEVDPNQDNGFAWYAALHFERGGESAREDAYRRVAALPGSWRAQLWLARSAISSGSFDSAIGLYRESLSRMGDPAPADALMQISGDLGNNGRLDDLLTLVGPSFRPTVHGLTVGNNLIKANLDLGRLDTARSMLESLAAQNIGPWREYLAHWDTEISKARLAANPVPQEPLSATLLTTEGPVWLKADSLAVPFFRNPALSAQTVYFIGSSATRPDQSVVITAQLADAPGRLSRALPLFLAEQVAFRTTAAVKTLTPWIQTGGCGFILSGVQWSNEDAATHVRKLSSGGVVVVSHLQTPPGDWSMEVRVVQVSDGSLLGSVSKSFTPERPDVALLEVVDQILPLLVRAGGVSREAAPSQYRIPTDGQLPHYLLHLEQLLAVRCSRMKSVPRGFLHGERSIVDGCLRQCVDCPSLLPPRLILVQVLLGIKDVRPEILPEYRERIAFLHDKYPLPQSEQQLLKKQFDEVFETSST